MDQTYNIHNGHGTFELFMPLIIDDKGNKIGKSDSDKAIFLNPHLTSHFSFYQYFMRLKDVDSIKFF